MFSRFSILLFATLAMMSFFAASYAGAQQAEEGYSEEGNTKEQIELPESGGDTAQKSDMKDLSHEEVRRMARQYAQEKLDSMHYLDPTFENISRLYWSMRVFDPDENYNSVNNYLLVNECEIFDKYFQNDFEWRKVHDATRDYLKKNRAAFPRRFQFIRPVRLGRYDLNAESFAVLDEDLRAGTRRYDIRAERENIVCGYRGFIEGYPDHVRMILNRPFQLLYVPVLKDAAYNYLARTNSQKDRGEYKNNFVSGERRGKELRDHSRVAFLRIRVRFVKFLGFARMSLGYETVEMFAVLEGFDVYEDPELTRLLFTTRN